MCFVGFVCWVVVGVIGGLGWYYSLDENDFY